jgi:hypothetical protein
MVDDDVDVGSASGSGGQTSSEVPGEAEVMCKYPSACSDAVPDEQNPIRIGTSGVHVRGVGSRDDALPRLGAEREPEPDEGSGHEGRK